MSDPNVKTASECSYQASLALDEMLGADRERARYWLERGLEGLSEIERLRALVAASCKKIDCPFPSESDASCYSLPPLVTGSMLEWCAEQKVFHLHASEDYGGLHDAILDPKKPKHLLLIRFIAGGEWEDEEVKLNEQADSLNRPVGCFDKNSVIGFLYELADRATKNAEAWRNLNG